MRQENLVKIACWPPNNKNSHTSGFSQSIKLAPTVLPLWGAFDVLQFGLVWFREEVLHLEMKTAQCLCLSHYKSLRQSHTSTKWFAFWGWTNEVTVKVQLPSADGKSLQSPSRSPVFWSLPCPCQPAVSNGLSVLKWKSGPIPSIATRTSCKQTMVEGMSGCLALAILMCLLVNFRWIWRQRVLLRKVEHVSRVLSVCPIILVISTPFTCTFGYQDHWQS